MGIQVIIVFNKIDLLNQEVEDFYKKIKSTYEKLKFLTLETSVISGKGIDDLKKILKNKLSCFNGRSGVGKSSLIKLLDPRYKDIRIGNISSKYDRGIHTTNFSKIYQLQFGAKIIDTPGIRELAVFIDKPEDVERNIRDFKSYRDKCRFPNCQHIDEPGCKVIEALEKNKIESFRYESYLRIRETIDKLTDSVI